MLWSCQGQFGPVVAAASLWERNANGRSVPAAILDLLEFGDTPSTSGELLVRVHDALAEEIALMLEEGVVTTAQDIDLCMLTGAGWPLQLGGITPYLDRVGASERVNGRFFHPGPERAATGVDISLASEN